MMIVARQQKPFKSHHAGFSLVEMLLAGFVLSFGLVAIVGTLGPAIKTTADSRDRAVAAFLAQEGAEVIKNIRDENMLNGRAFDTGISTGSYCVNRSGTTGCPTGYKIGVDASGWFDPNGVSTTEFRRRVDTRTSGNELDVTVLVTWNNADVPSSIADCSLVTGCAFARTVLTNWKD